MLALDHGGATLAQLRELGLQAVVQDADQRADDEDSAEGDREHREQEAAAALVAAHRARVEGPEQAQAQQRPEVEVRVALVPGDENDERHDDDEHDRDDEQPDDQRDRPPAHELVEAIPQAVAPVHRR